MADTKWFVQLQGQVYGPLTATELKNLAARGDVTAKSPLSQDAKTWVTAGTVRGLVFASSPHTPALPSKQITLPNGTNSSSNFATQEGTLPAQSDESGFDLSWLPESKRKGLASPKGKRHSRWWIATLVGIGVTCIGVAIAIVARDTDHAKDRESKKPASRDNADERDAAETLAKFKSAVEKNRRDLVQTLGSYVRIGMTRQEWLKKNPTAKRFFDQSARRGQFSYTVDHFMFGTKMMFLNEQPIGAVLVFYKADRNSVQEMLEEKTTFLGPSNTKVAWHTDKNVIREEQWELPVDGLFIRCAVGADAIVDVATRKRMPAYYFEIVVIDQDALSATQ